MSVDFWIEFDSPSRSYWPGKEVSGKVVVVCTKARKTEGLKIKLEGKASTRWNETDSSTLNMRSFEDAETVMKYEFYALGDGKSIVSIPVGRNEYPFRYELPKGLPSSFVGEYGKMGYWVVVRLKRSWKADREIKGPFSVNAIVDLNTEPIASKPVGTRDSKQLCCFCCASGHIGYVLKVVRQGYVPGEFADFEVQMTNHTSRKVTGATLSLVQTVKYYAQNQSRFKTETKTLVTITRGGFERGESDPWKGNLLQIPSVPPSRLGKCRLINVQYKLQFEMEISGLTLNLKDSIPIFIGTIPFRNTFNNFAGRNGNEPTLLGPTISEEYPDLPPPSYEDAIRGDLPPYPGDNEEYVPKYAMYGLKN